MHSLCAGRVLLQNTHSHKYISTLRVSSAPVKGQPADRVLASMAAAVSGGRQKHVTLNIEPPELLHLKRHNKPFIRM